MQIVKFILLIHLAFKVEIALSLCDTNFTSIQAFIDNLDKITLPVDQFNVKCMGLDCPSLLNLPCPYNSNDTIDDDVYSRVISTVQSCLSQRKTICSTPIDPIPICPMNLALQSLLSSSDIEGSLSVVPNTSSVTGLSRLTLTYDSSFIYVNVPKLVYAGQVVISAGIKGSDQKYSTQTTPASTTANVSLVLSVQTQPRVSVRVISNTITASAQYGKLFASNPGDDVLGIVQILLDYGSQVAVQGSNIPKDLGTFLGTIIANAIETAALKCKSI